MRTGNGLIEIAVLLLWIWKSGLIARTLRYRIPTNFNARYPIC